MTGPWIGSLFPVTAFGRAGEIQLGKMLQPASISAADEETPYLRAGNLAQLDFADLPTMFASLTESARYAVRLGDLLVAEGGDVGRAEFVGHVPAGTIIQNSLHRVRSSSADLRFLRYCLQAAYSSGWLDVICNRSTFGHLTREKLASLRVPLPERGMQQALADYLDAETTRIDAVVEKKRRMIELLDERSNRLFAASLEARGFRWGRSLEQPGAGQPLPTGWKVAHLSVLLDQLTNGYVGPTRDVLVDEGVRYVQSLHIKNGKIDFERRPFYVPKAWHEERPRIHLRPGDVLIVQTGDVGQVAVVPPGFGPASCHALQIARVRRDVLTGEYLGSYLRSSFGRQSLLSRVTGALHPHLEGGIRDIPVVVPPLNEQRAVVAEVSAASERIGHLQSLSTRQIDLLDEHRQALIAAAVTGQLDVAKAAA